MDEIWSIEVKKIYMDEQTGEPDPAAIDAFSDTFGQAIRRLKAELVA